jgi:hypothetical protein
MVELSIHKKHYRLVVPDPSKDEIDLKQEV